MNIVIIKKDGTKEKYNPEKIKNAVTKSAIRVLVDFSAADLDKIISIVEREITKDNLKEVPIIKMHNYVEAGLEESFPMVAKSYRDYRNYKYDFVNMLDEVYSKSQAIMYIGDKENSNTDSALVSTKRSLIFNQLNKELYKKFFLNVNELQAINDGYIYIHDMSARRDTMNCCLFDIQKVLSGGFEMGNMWYSEPKTLDVAFDVMGDVVLSTSAQQYGGFTLPSLDETLAPYAEKSFKIYTDKYVGLGIDLKKAEEMAYKDVDNDLLQGFQGLEYKFNTIGSSRGDYPFITVTIGLATSRFGKLAAINCLKTRARGQGKKGFKRPVLFPKIVFLFDEELHTEGKVLNDVFNEGIKCSSVAMYPDWLSLNGDGYIAQMYKKYGKAVSPMGCRAFLSPWYVRGGAKPADENDDVQFVGRFNIGAISLNLPLILAKAQRESKDFYEVLEHYLQLTRQLHIKTYDYLGEMKASTNPLAYCEGGFYGGNLGLHDKIKPLLASATASFGYTALNELQRLYNGKSIAEDGEFALDVLKYINERIECYKNEDGHLYAIYGTPAESLCGLQVKQFRKLYGIVENVSDRAYVSNSFHCHVSEDISPIEKQDLEEKFWEYSKGGRIQYVKYPINYNYEAIRTLVLRAMKKGYYEGVNLSLSYCDDCGYEELSMEVCPKCGSKNVTKIERMNGYLSYSRVKGDTRLNDAKMEEIAERKSM